MKSSAMASPSLGRSGRGARTPDDASSKPNHRSGVYDTPTVNGKMKAQRGPRDRSSDSHRRHSPFEEVDSSERSFREPSSERDDWRVQEADVGVDMDMDMEDVRTWKASDSSEKGMTVKGGMDEGDGEDIWYGLFSEEGSGEDEADEDVYPGEAFDIT